MLDEKLGMSEERRRDIPECLETTKLHFPWDSKSFGVAAVRLLPDSSTRFYTAKFSLKARQLGTFET